MCLLTLLNNNFHVTGALQILVQYLQCDCDDGTVTEDERAVGLFHQDSAGAERNLNRLAISEQVRLLDRLENRILQQRSWGHFH